MSDLCFPNVNINNESSINTVHNDQVNEEIKREGSRINQYVSATCACITIASYGAYQAWSSPSIPYLTSNSSSLPITKEQSVFIISFYNLGDLLGGLLNPLFIDRIGRKNTLLLFTLPALIGWILIIFARNYMYLYAARLIAGIGQGGTFSSLVIYLTEISEKDIRGIQVNMIHIALAMSVFIFTSIAAFESYQILNISSVAVPILFLLLFPFLPESPYYFILKEKNEDALKCLMNLRKLTSPHQLEAEIREMKIAVDEDRKSSKKFAIWQLISKSYNRKGLMIIFCMKVTQLLSGRMAISFYAQEIFSYGNLSLAHGVQVMILTGISLFACLFTNLLIDRFNRRKLFLVTGILSSICLASVGASFFIMKYFKSGVPHLGWLTLVALVLFEVVYLMGIGTIPYVTQGEIFSINVKGAAVAYGMVLGSCFTFSTTTGYKYLTDSAGAYTTFWLFAAVALLGSLLTFWITPDTTGISLEEIQAMQNPELRIKLEQERRG